MFHRYYALEVSYFKSSLDRKLLELLWNKYWVNTLSSSSLLTVSTLFPRDAFEFYLSYISYIISETFFHRKAVSDLAKTLGLGSDSAHDQSWIGIVGQAKICVTYHSDEVQMTNTCGQMRVKSAPALKIQREKCKYCFLFCQVTQVGPQLQVTGDQTKMA